MPVFATAPSPQVGFFLCCERKIKAQQPQGMWQGTGVALGMGTGSTVGSGTGVAWGWAQGASGAAGQPCSDHFVQSVVWEHFENWQKITEKMKGKALK